MQVSRIAISIATSPQVKKGYRAAKSLLPFVGAFGLYHISPDIKHGIDQVREFLGQWPRAFEIATSSLTMGFFPDLMAQRYESDEFRWGRSFGMTALGGVTGGVILREFYDFQMKLIPGQGLWPTVQRVLVDQFNYTPVYFSGYLAYTHLIQGKPWKGFFQHWRAKMVEVLPKNWLYWGAACSVIYNLPSDLMVYALNFFALLWFGYLSRVAHDQPTGNLAK